MNRTLSFLAACLFSTCLQAQTGTANNNVVVDGIAENLTLYADYPFAVPENFEAELTNIHRSVRSGYNTFYLPFFVNRDEIPSNNGKTYVYSSQDHSKVTFERKDGIDANVPFLMTEVTACEVITFTNRKGVVATTNGSIDDIFVGVYDGITSAADKWGIGNEDKFVKGGENATIRSFAAYLTVPTGNANAKQIVLNDGEVDGIESASLNDKGQMINDNAVYDIMGRKVADNYAFFASKARKSRIRITHYALQKGIYIINGKKILVK